MMRPILFFGLFLLVCCIGCPGGGTVGKGKGFGVSGKVTFADGKPLSSGQITLESRSFTGNGSILPDGTYNISGRVPAGTYKVAVKAGDAEPLGTSFDKADTKSAKPQIDPKFNNAETSGLVCEVSGPTEFDVKVEPPK